MTAAFLEHVNVTVTDPDHTAALLCRLFNWHVRWAGDAIGDGRSVHVGTKTGYLAVYSAGRTTPNQDSTYETRGALNHIGVVVEDLDATERRVIEEGFGPFSHQTYDPGRRFYFNDDNGIEFEVVSYD